MKENIVMKDCAPDLIPVEIQTQNYKLLYNSY